MNKNLEKEYLELMAEDMPDLWDRIEAGILPKEHLTEGRDQTRSRGRQGRRTRYAAWGITAAACLCLAVVGFRTAFSGRFDAMPGQIGGEGNADGKDDSLRMNEGEWAGMAAEDVYGNTDGAGEQYAAMESAMPAEEASAVLEVRVRVLEVLDGAAGMAYRVQVEESTSEELSEGEIIRICGSGIPEEGLTERETYRMGLSGPLDDGGEPEYLAVTVRIWGNE